MNIYFDSNVYQALNNMEMDRICKLEKDKKVNVFASGIVMVELLTKYRNNPVKYYTLIKRFVQHVGAVLSPPQIIMDPNYLIAHDLWGIRHKDVEETYRGIAGVLRRISMNEDISDDEESIIELVQLNKSHEEWFVDILRDTLNRLKTAETDKAGFERTIWTHSNNYVQAIILRLELLKKYFDDIKDKNSAVKQLVAEEEADFIAKKYLLYFTMWAYITKKVFVDGISIDTKSFRKSKANWLWDLRIAGAVTSYDKKSLNLTLVTDDKDINKVKNIVGYESRVLKLKEYKALLNAPLP